MNRNKYLDYVPGENNVNDYVPGDNNVNDFYYAVVHVHEPSNVHLIETAHRGGFDNFLNELDYKGLTATPKTHTKDELAVDLDFCNTKNSKTHDLQARFAYHISHNMRGSLRWA